MQIRSISSIVALVISFTILSMSQQTTIKRVPITRTPVNSGSGMYKAYCAVCHGVDGKGGGPAAAALRVPPSDLSRLAKANGGKYPSEHVASVIRGDVRLAAHGSREMPVWGALFWSMSQGQSSEVLLRIANLSRYVETLQAK